MSSREKILQDVLANQPAKTPLPDLEVFSKAAQDTVQQYTDMFSGIGGTVFTVEDPGGITAYIAEHYDVAAKRIITTLPELSGTAELYSPSADPHTFADVELAVLRAHLAVAENGAVWLTDELMGHRILPFICQHLAVVITAESIVPTMHEAYAIIGEGRYGFGSFIGGPSKTADIEQALVMGAHGPITMTVFILQ